MDMASLLHYDLGVRKGGDFSSLAPPPGKIPNLPRLPKQQFGDWVQWLAPAKLNLTLRVVGRRADGYHELDSVVCRISLCDELRFLNRLDGELAVDCPTDCGPVEKNLVSRAALLLKQSTGCGGGAEIRLAKHIPVGAGLGGGSSDAATTLMALNELWQINLPAAKLAELAIKLGSDVPLFLSSPAVRMQGKGEILSPLQVRPFFAILFFPPFSCPTPQIYQAYDRQRENSPQAQACAPVEAGNPQSPAEIDFAQRPSRWAKKLQNDLLFPALEVCDRLAHFLHLLARETHLPVHMSGSGSTLFILADTTRDAQTIAATVPDILVNRCSIVSTSPF
jgi:4-diphosphocytidyl-2C-methyl-D-erythritol kinase